MTFGMRLEDWNAPPRVNWRHIDGPMLMWRGGCYWLTLGDRLQLWLGLTSLPAIARRAFPDRA